MTLYEKIKSIYPQLEDKDFVDNIRLRNDSDGNGDYIEKWEHLEFPRPSNEQLS